MTDTRTPEPCTYDRTLQERVTRRHRQTCNSRDCDGCAPCTAPHCGSCSRGHLDNDHPQTCISCIKAIRSDLTDIISADRAMRTQAYAGTSRTGRLLAAAPIPGGDAQVLIGPSVSLGKDLHVGRGIYPWMIEEDHSDKDPIPPLAVLARWEDEWRTWLSLAPAGRASIATACAFLRDDVVPLVAQDDPKNGGPDFASMAWEIRWIRDQLERSLHDEREPERGVECFECDAKLVRRYHRPKPCGCPPRPILEHATHGRCDCIAGFLLEHNEKGQPYVVLQRWRDPDDGHLHAPEHACCIACQRETEWENNHAGHNQGGLTDPTVGMSWECSSCRRSYTPGEYQNAVRVGLARSKGGWINIPIAAQAAQAVAGRPVTDKTVRGWVNREWVKSRIDLSAFGVAGPRLVRWSDVRREAERLGAGRNQCTHVTVAREWMKTLLTYPELEVTEEEEDAVRESCQLCLAVVEATLKASRRSGSSTGRSA